MVDVTAVWPGLTGTAVRTAAEAFRRGTDAVSPPGASWTTSAAIARQERAALITVAAGATGCLRGRGQDIVHLWVQ